MGLTVVYAGEELPSTTTATLFLAGPTPRASVGASAVRAWRQEAIEILGALGFSGQVIIPEPRAGWTPDYDGQITWECDMRECADLILFWVPRALAGRWGAWAKLLPARWRGTGPMPAFTTNIEFGEDLHRGRILYGRPSAAPKNRYLDARYREVTGEEPYADLRALLERAMAVVGAGAPRTGGAREVPLHIWTLPSFQSWLAARTESDQRLDGFRVLRVFGPSAPGASPFLWVARVKVWDPREGRTKSNEVVVARPDTVSVVPFLSGGSGQEVVFVEELRATGSNPTGLVHEWPGGSSPKPAESVRLVALEELAEELGLGGVAADRLVPLGARQACATMLSHRVEAFALGLTPEESARVRALAEGTEPTGADAEERTRVRVCNLDDLAMVPMDWGQLGMLSAALAARKPCRGWFGARP